MGEVVAAVGFVLSLLVVLAFIGSAIGWFYVVAEVIGFRSEHWRAAGQDQILWFVLLFTVNVLVVIPYFLLARPRLKAAESNR